MSKLEIQTDKIREAAENLGKVAKKVDSTTEEIAGLDTANDDNFDFDGTKVKIAKAVNALSYRFVNATGVLGSVADQHDKLQESLRIDKNGGSSDKSGNDASTTDSGQTTGDNSTYDDTTSGGYTGSGGYSSGGGSSGSRSKNGIETGVAAVTSEIAKEKIEGSLTTAETTNENIVDDTPIETKEFNITNKVTDVGYAYIKEEILSNNSKDFMQNAKFNSETGYSMVGDRYVVACDSSLGSVGDVLKINKTDGINTECIVGINTHSSQYKNVLNFIVDRDTWQNHKPLDISEKLLTNRTEIINLGNYQNLNTVKTSNFENKTLGSIEAQLKELTKSTSDSNSVEFNIN